MATERITLNIQADVKKMGKFLKAINADRSQYVKFLENPGEVLGRNGIDLEKYGSKTVAYESIVGQITGMVNDIVAVKLAAVAQGLAARTSPEQSTRTMSTTNFDHKSGTTSFTSRSTHTGFDAGFAGLELANPAVRERVVELLTGPLISSKAALAIQVNMKAALTHAEQALHG